MKKGQMWISFVIFLLIGVSVLIIILKAGTPIANRLRDRVAFTKAENTMLSVDQTIDDVARESLGSQRVVPIDIPDGKVIIGSNAIKWEMETDAKIIEPRTSIDRGDVKITADASVSARQNGSSFILENDILLANISSVGNASSWQSINASRLISYIEFKANSKRIANVSFNVGGLAGSEAGQGYSALLDDGTLLGKSAVLARINSSAVDYELLLTLESGADFLKIQTRNVVVK